MAERMEDVEGVVRGAARDIRPWNRIVLAGIGLAASICVFLGLLLLVSYVGVDMPEH